MILSRTKENIIKNIFIYSLTFFTLIANAQENSLGSSPYILDKIDVVEGIENEETGDVITQDDMQRDDAHDLWEAVRYTPGITLSAGGRRNESSFSVRGFSADSVPLFVDGVSVANPYKGNGDAARILTGDLESVTIQKGYSSRLLGANTLGGAILMRTAKPKKSFEARLDATVEFDSVYKESAENYLLSAGAKQELFYLKGTFQYRDIDHFRLSNDFKPTSVNPQQPGNRLFSDSSDTKYTLLAGLTPSSNFDIWATYIYQDADKGVSPPETTIQDYAIWDWIKWKRESISLASTYDNGRFKLDALLHYDKYDNALNEYYNMASYKAGVHDRTSIYDEYSTGGRITAGWTFNKENKIETAATLKREEHSGFSGEKREIYILEDTISVGVEYTYVPFSNLRFVAGVGYDALEPRDFQSKTSDFAELIGSDSYVVKPQAHWLIAGQLGIFYEFMPKHELHLTYARKNRFPTMSERYTTRYGRQLPNPHLQPEVADHYELGYKGKFSRFSINTALYYSPLTNKVVTIIVPNPDYPSIPVDYYINLDKVTFYGYELGGEAFIDDYMTAGVSLSLNGYNIGKSANKAAEVIDYYPAVTASGYMFIALSEHLSVVPRVEYVDSRYASIDKSDKLDSYVVANLKATYDYNDYISFSAKVNNIFDEEYEIRQFYPQAGRSFSLTLSAKF